MSGASNIRSVSLDGDVLTIIGEIAGLLQYDPELSLLHVWLAQPACPGKPGAGLAIDCFAISDTPPAGTPSIEYTRNSFTLTVPLGPPPPPGVAGKFFEGPATVSVIAVLV